MEANFHNLRRELSAKVKPNTRNREENLIAAFLSDNSLVARVHRRDMLIFLDSFVRDKFQA